MPFLPRTPARLALLCLVLSASSALCQAIEPATPTSAPAPQPLTGNFFERLAHFYAQDWAGTLPASATPKRRLPDAPLDSPPFPNPDWNYNTSPDIGAPDGNTYPLMSALHLDNSRTKFYGWINPGANVSTSSKSNYPLAYDIFANRLELDQAVIYLERLPDTVQNDHFSFGYHLTALYGIDYRFTTAKGYFSDQLLKYNRQNGFDPVLEYVDLYFPVKDGLNIRVGRLLSVAGIEAQLSPNNYNMTHSLLYNVDPFTATGAVATLKLNNQWLVQAGLSAGHDIAPWSSGAKASVTGCVDYSTKSNKNNFDFCADGINDGQYSYNNIQFYDAVWYHKFNSKWHSATESWFLYELNVPNISPNAVNPLPLITGANGAFCTGGVRGCFAPAWAALNYINREISPKLLIGFRSDILADKKGQRTGVATKYTENTLYMTKFIGSTVQVRPEIRFDKSWDRAGYDNGTKSNQFFAGIDLIYHF